MFFHVMWHVLGRVMVGGPLTRAWAFLLFFMWHFLGTVMVGGPLTVFFCIGMDFESLRAAETFWFLIVHVLFCTVMVGGPLTASFFLHVAWLLRQWGWQEPSLLSMFFLEIWCHVAWFLRQWGWEEPSLSMLFLEIWWWRGVLDFSFCAGKVWQGCFLSIISHVLRYVGAVMVGRLLTWVTELP